MDTTVVVGMGEKQERASLGRVRQTPPVVKLIRREVPQNEKNGNQIKRTEEEFTA